MIIHTRERIRIAFNVESHKPQTDEIDGATPQMWRNNDVQFELGFFFDEEPITASDFSEIKLIVKENENRLGSAPLMSATVAPAGITPVFTVEEWQAKSAQHCIFTFTADETRLDLRDKTERTFWLAVIARTAAGRRITLGSSKLKMHHDGEDETSTAPPLGSSIIPLGESYNGAGVYVVTGLTAGRHYGYAMGDNDTKLVNGPQELTEDGNFQANGTTVTLEGTASTLITATIRYPTFLTLEEMDARYARANTPWRLSPDGTKMLIVSVTNDKQVVNKVIDLTNL